MLHVLASRDRAWWNTPRGHLPCRRHGPQPQEGVGHADAAIAIGAGTDVAIETADIVLMRSDPLDVPIALQIGRGTLHKPGSAGQCGGRRPVHRDSDEPPDAVPGGHLAGAADQN
jgi:hypothetical protein